MRIEAAETPPLASRNRLAGVKAVMRARSFVLLVAGVALACAAPARAQSPVERGRYLVEAIGSCGNCHTTRGPDGPIAGMTLAGNNVIEDGPAFRAVSANITQDRETGIGAWTDRQIATAIREGIRPDGSVIGPPMPIARYRCMADDDVAAIVAYLRTVPPVSNRAEKSIYRMALPPNYGPPVGHVDAPQPSDLVRTGAYLAGPLGHCIECHSPLREKGGRDLSRIGAGGQLFKAPPGADWGASAAANITSDPVAGIGAWSDAEIERAIRTGVSRDGHRLKPPMGYASYAGITPADMTALIAYLRTLPPPPP